MAFCEQEPKSIIFPLDVCEYWQTPVDGLEDVPAYTSKSRNKAYILPDDSIWVWNYDGTELIQMCTEPCGGGGETDPTTIESTDGNIVVNGSGTFDVTLTLGQNVTTGTKVAQFIGGVNQPDLLNINTLEFTNVYSFIQESFCNVIDNKTIEIIENGTYQILMAVEQESRPTGSVDTIRPLTNGNTLEFNILNAYPSIKNPTAPVTYFGVGTISSGTTIQFEKNVLNIGGSWSRPRMTITKISDRF